MSKIELNETNSGYNLQKINRNFQKIEEEFNDKVLYRDNPNGEPNEMLNDLDMNGNRVYNLPVPAQEHEAARLKDVQNAIADSAQANLIEFAPYGSITSTNVQGAIQELEDRKANAADLNLKVNTADLASSDPGKGAEMVGFLKSASGAIPGSVNYRLEETVSLLDFMSDSDRSSVLGGSMTDVTDALLLASDHMATAGGTLTIPRGNMVISDTIPLPDEYSIVGQGIGSHFYLDLTANSFAFDSDDFVRMWSLEGLRFSPLAGAPTNVGAVRVQKHLRGGLVYKLWSYGLDTPYVFEGDIWGALAVRSIHAYRLGTSANDGVGISCQGNTIFMDGIEVIGNFDIGVWHKGGRVGSLSNFNVAGSEGEYFMRTGIVFENCNVMSIRDGWLEHNGSPSTGNGLAEAIYLYNCSETEVEGVNISTGSLWLDGGTANKVDRISYAQINGGLLARNGAEYSCTASALKFQRPTISRSRPTQVDVSGGTAQLLSNPTLTTGGETTLVATNAAVVTIVDDTTNQISGDRCFEVVSNEGHGMRTVDLPCVAGQKYTAVAMVRNLGTQNASRSIGLDVIQNADIDTSRLMCAETFEANSWTKLILPFTATGSSVSVGVRAIGGEAWFLIDSFQVFRGTNHTSPSEL